MRRPKALAGRGEQKFEHGAGGNETSPQRTAMPLRLELVDERLHQRLRVAAPERLGVQPYRGPSGQQGQSHHASPRLSASAPPEAWPMSARKRAVSASTTVCPSDVIR